MRRKAYRLALLILLSILLFAAVALGYAIGPGSRLNGYAIERLTIDYEKDKDTALF